MYEKIHQHKILKDWNRYCVALVTRSCGVCCLVTNPLRVPDDAVSLIPGALLVSNTPVAGVITYKN